MCSNNKYLDIVLPASDVHIMISQRSLELFLQFYFEFNVVLTVHRF